MNTIKFKNGSEITTVETEGKTVRSSRPVPNYRTLTTIKDIVDCMEEDFDIKIKWHQRIRLYLCASFYKLKRRK